MVCSKRDSPAFEDASSQVPPLEYSSVLPYCSQSMQERGRTDKPTTMPPRGHRERILLITSGVVNNDKRELLFRDPLLTDLTSIQVPEPPPTNLFENDFFNFVNVVPVGGQRRIGATRGPDPIADARSTQLPQPNLDRDCNHLVSPPRRIVDRLQHIECFRTCHAIQLYRHTWCLQFATLLQIPSQSMVHHLSSIIIIHHLLLMSG